MSANTSTTLLVLVVLVTLTVPASVAVAAPPPPPAAYYGSLTVNGDPAKAGVTVTAKIDGEVRGSLTTTQIGAYGDSGAFDPKLQVNGTDVDDGKTVVFSVNGVQANETATWQSGAIVQVDLTVTGDVYPATGGSSGSGGGQPSQETETPEPDEGDDDPPIERINISVKDAKANETVSVNLSEERSDQVTPAPDGNLTLDGLDIEVEQDSDIDLNITTSDQPPADDAPSFSLDDGTEPLGFIRVDHTIPDEAIGNVSFAFRVKKDKLDERGTDPSNVALYRFHDGNWNELPTTLVRTTDTHYIFEAVSPGLSDFATGLKNAKFELSNADVSVSSVTLGDSVDIQVQIENIGGADGTFNAELKLDGVTVASRDVTIAAGGSRLVTFERSFDQSGTYRLTVNDVPAGRVSVNEGTTASIEATETVSQEETETNGGGLDGFGMGTALVALLSLSLLARFR